MPTPPLPSNAPHPVLRVLGILFGVLLVFVAALVAISGVALVTSASPRANPLILIGLGAFLSLASAWMLLLAWRFIAWRPRRDGGLLPKPFLAICAAIYISTPLLVLITGAYKVPDPHERWERFFQAVVYAAFGFGILRLIERRSTGGHSHDVPPEENDGGA